MQKSWVLMIKQGFAGPTRAGVASGNKGAGTTAHKCWRCQPARRQEHTVSVENGAKNSKDSGIQEEELRTETEGITVTLRRFPEVTV